MDIAWILLILAVGMLGLAVYVLSVCLRSVVNRLADISEKLMIIAGTQGGNDATGRALVAMSRQPRGEMLGMAQKKQAKPEKKPEKPKPVRVMTVGSI